jgi:hypothetical protein
VKCLSTTYHGDSVAEDANAAAAAYVELGKAPADAYNEAVGIIGRKIEKVYKSKEGRQLNVMKCVDLFFDPELDALARSTLP